METNLVKDDELELLLNRMIETYGYDFTNYARASLKRRVNRLLVMDRFPSFAEFLYRLSNDAEYFNRVVDELTVTVTEMFRDPHLFKTLRDEVLPVLATHPFIRIWHAGSCTGEEVYSMAIMLKEAGLLEKSLIYATDLNAAAVERIRSGIFPLDQMKQYSESYISSGGKK